jgi:hypothetical protein
MIKIAPTYVAAAMLAALAILFGVGAFKLGFWVDDTPGPGLLPLVISLLLLPLLFVAMREPIPSDETSFKALPLVAVMLAIIYALTLPYVGFVPASVLMLVVWIRFFYGQGWFGAIICSTTLTAGGVVIFNVLLKVPMPLFAVWQ